MTIATHLRAHTRVSRRTPLPQPASLGLTNCSQVDMLGLRHKSVNFKATTGKGGKAGGGERGGGEKGGGPFLRKDKFGQLYAKQQPGVCAEATLAP